jgi:hypothetical protein
MGNPSCYFKDKLLFKLFQGILRLKCLLDGGQARLQAFRGKDLQTNPCRAVQLFKVKLL